MSWNVTRTHIPLNNHVTSGYESCNDSLGVPTNRTGHILVQIKKKQKIESKFNFGSVF